MRPRVCHTLAAALAVLILDLDGDGLFTGEGRDGVLVFDADKDGRPGESDLESFGVASDVDGDGKPDGFMDGFQALAALARRAAAKGALPPFALEDGRLDAVELSYLEKTRGLRVRILGRDPPVLLSFREAGVDSLVLPHGQRRRLRSAKGGEEAVLYRPGAIFTRRDDSADAYAQAPLAK